MINYLFQKKGLPPTETPPYLILNHADISKYLDKPNTASSNSEGIN